MASKFDLPTPLEISEKQLLDICFKIGEMIKNKSDGRDIEFYTSLIRKYGAFASMGGLPTELLPTISDLVEVSYKYADARRGECVSIKKE